MRTDETKFRQDVQSGVHAYSIGRFRLDLQRGELLCDGQHIPLRPKSFDVLHYLVSHAGELISREALLESVWPDLVVTDDSLTQCLIEIRKALGDDEKKIIVTLPRRGYRLEAEVQSHGASEQITGLPDRQPTAADRMPSRWTIVALIVLAVAIGATWWQSDTGPETENEQASDWSPLPTSIAVLPFADMSETGDRGYLAEGVSEEILNSLARSQDMTVIARTSSFSFKDSKADIKTIARHLNVANVLEGSVRVAGERVRVTAQLVDGRTEAHIWSQTYDDRLQDVFAMQDRIANEVAAVLKVEMTGNPDGGVETRKHVPDQKAWEAYMRGRLFYGRRSDGDIIRAQNSFENALEIDPEFADAWVSLAATLNLRTNERGLSPEVRLEREVSQPLIRDALEKALLLDPQNPEALWRLSFFAFFEGRQNDAIDLMKRALPPGRNHAMVQAMMGGLATETGEPELAIPFLRRTVALDPLSSNHQSNLGNLLYIAGNFSEAELVYQRAMELNPDYAEWANQSLAWIRINQGDLESAAGFAQKLSPGPDLDMTLAILDHLRGDDSSAEQAIERLLSIPPEKGAQRLANVYAMRGDSNAAFESLNLVLETSIMLSPSFTSRVVLAKLLHSSFLNNLHSDTRWETWREAAMAELQGSFVLEVLDLLRDHLDRHPELYEFDTEAPDPHARESADDTQGLDAAS